MAQGRWIYILSSAVREGGVHAVSESDNEARLTVY